MTKITTFFDFYQYPQLVNRVKDIKERHIIGLNIDGHGDLHTGNIFLLNQPIIFDCIEFNPHYRQMDVLSELAFLCMDLDFYGYEGLATYFMQRYNINYPIIIALPKNEYWIVFLGLFLCLLVNSILIDNCHALLLIKVIYYYSNYQ